MRAVLAALALAAAPAAAYDDYYDEPVALQRHLADLQLGDSLEDVQRIYPPAADWPSHMDARGRVRRYRVERGAAKAFPLWTQTMWLGFRRGRLVDIQIVYDAKRTREKTHEELAGDLSLSYGEPTRSGERFWWSDSRTVLRVFPAEVPVNKDGETVTQWRTSMQIMEKDLFSRATDG